MYVTVAWETRGDYSGGLEAAVTVIEHKHNGLRILQRFSVLALGPDDFDAVVADFAALNKAHPDNFFFIVFEGDAGDNFDYSLAPENKDAGSLLKSIVS